MRSKDKIMTDEEFKASINAAIREQDKDEMAARYKYFKNLTQEQSAITIDNFENVFLNPDTTECITLSDSLSAGYPQLSVWNNTPLHEQKEKHMPTLNIFLKDFYEAETEEEIERCVERLKESLWQRKKSWQEWNSISRINTKIR